MGYSGEKCGRRGCEDCRIIGREIGSPGTVDDIRDWLKLVLYSKLCTRINNAIRLSIRKDHSTGMIEVTGTWFIITY